MQKSLNKYNRDVFEFTFVYTDNNIDVNRIKTQLKNNN